MGAGFFCAIFLLSFFSIKEEEAGTKDSTLLLAQGDPLSQSFAALGGRGGCLRPRAKLPGNCGTFRATLSRSGLLGQASFFRGQFRQNLGETSAERFSETSCKFVQPSSSEFQKDRFWSVKGVFVPF